MLLLILHRAKENQDLSTAYLSFGSNIEPRLSFLNQAVDAVSKEVGRLARLSGIYESEPWGFEAVHYFLNRVAVVETDLPPQEVLQRVLSIERKMGRKRQRSGYASRQIDIDILYYDHLCLDEPGLTLPHPAIAQRRFVLAPLAEVAGEFMHPVYKKNNADLLKQCSDNLQVRLYPIQKENKE